MNHKQKIVEAIRQRQQCIDQVRERRRELQRAETAALNADLEVARQIKNVTARKPVLLGGWIYELDADGKLAVRQAEFEVLRDG